MNNAQVQIRYLVDHPEVLGELAAGFKAQWSSHFADQPLEAIKMSFVGCCRDQGLPLTVIALEDETFCGTATLRGDSEKIRPELGPWLSHLYVVPAWRGRGIGATLIRAIEAEAARHGFAELHAATARAARLFERMGWQPFDLVDYQGDRVAVLRKELAGESH
jgi:GNAT superfamily N-acetyltransferase